MAVNLGSTGQPDFDRPIELMMDCHRRIEHFQSVLQRVVDRYGQSGVRLDDEGRRALETALHYFREAAPHHTADEEDSLFPRLRALGRDDLEPILQRAEKLERDHVRANELHGRVDRIGREWLERGWLEASERSLLDADLEELAGLYKAHIALEDEEVFPAANRALDGETLARIGREMAERRGLSVSSAEART